MPLSVFKFVMFMTDGRSNRLSNECGNTTQAAAALTWFAEDNSVLVYAVAVTNNVNLEELELIATSPEFITHLDSFDSTDLDNTQQLQVYELCFTASASKCVGESSGAIIGDGERICINFPLPMEVSLTAPNSAVHDWMSEIGIGCDDIFIDPRDVENANIDSNNNSNQVETNNCRRKRLALNSTMNQYADSTRYVLIEGAEEDNSFVFRTTTGDTSTPDQPCMDTSGVIIGCAVGGGMLLLLLLLVIAIV